jgi:hypothetical protein
MANCRIWGHLLWQERYTSPPVAFKSAQRDRILATDKAPFDDVPTGGLQGGIDMFGAGFSFVHHRPDTLSKDLAGSSYQFYKAHAWDADIGQIAHAWNL